MKERQEKKKNNHKDRQKEKNELLRARAAKAYP